MPRRSDDWKKLDVTTNEPLKVRRGLVTRHPGDVAAREGLARSLNNLANLYLARNELEQARATFTEAIEQRESLVKFRPEEPNHKSSLANTYKDLETLQTDPQFEPLRGQAGYQDLLRECEAAVRGKTK